MDGRIFTATFDREVRVSVDGRTITHRAGAWSADYAPETLPKWIGFYERLAEDPNMLQAKADVEVLHAVRDLLAARQT